MYVRKPETRHKCLVTRKTVEKTWWKARVLLLDSNRQEMLVYCGKLKKYGWVHMKCDVRVIGLKNEGYPSMGTPMFEVPMCLLESKEETPGRGD